jgi:hypothetical protein
MKTATAVNEKIKVVDDDQQEDVGENMITIILQTEEGRKSRMKFLIFKDESFENVLKKYLEKRDLMVNNWEACYGLVFDGDRVNLKETPVDLDLDGDEVFDVKNRKN